jgi:glycosyltransferase involved in cell wall biosynthesis
MPTRLSLVMPAYNEAAGIADAVAEAHEALAGLGYEFELLVVDDGSADGTGARVAELAALWPRVRLLTHSTNLGYGAALRTGFEAARYDLVAFTDADGQFFLDDLDDLVPLTRECHVAVGRRVNRQDPWRRRFLSWGYNRLARLFLGTGVRDCDCALKVFRWEALRYLLPESAGFFVNSEMLCRARRLGFAVAEVGVRHRPRRAGTSKVSLAEVPRTFATLVHFWWRHVVFHRPTAVPAVEAPVLLPFPRPAVSGGRKAA